MNEYRRRIKLGKTNFYCSLTCGAKTDTNISMIYNASKVTWFKGGENKLITEEQLLKSSMKEFAKRARNRNQRKNGNLDIQQMISVWNSQNGKCKYTGVDLILPHMDEYKTISHNYKASIDRIDSSKPYCIDNIQFISYTANNLKHTMTDKEVEEFFNIIRNK